MRNFLSVALLSGVALTTVTATPAYARVSRVEISTIKPAFGGRTFGNVGSYDLIEGIAYFEVDPKLPVNAGIKNLQRAPRNAKGMVELNVDIRILRPKNPQAGNGRLFFEPVNRGRPLSLGYLQNPASNSLEAPEGAGDGFLLNRGYTLVFSGWQPDYPRADVPAMNVGYGSRLPGPQGLKARLPIARGDNDRPITANIVAGEGFASAETDRRIHLTYPAADRTDASGYLRLPGTNAPLNDGSSWRYVNELEVAITRPAGSSAPVEFVYEAKDPFVYGLALASMRDLMSFLRYEKQGNPLAENGRKPIEKTIAFGASQTGRTVKTLVYLFNDDEQGRQVVDGAYIHISGASLNSQNEPFATPGDKYGAFPFTYETLYDPISRRFDGVLMRCTAQGNCPKIIHTDSEAELSFATSLLYTDALGNDVSIPENVRVYLFAGTQHGPAKRAAPGMCQNLSNPLPYAQPMRRLVLALDEWVTSDRAPPASRHPMRADRTLISVAEAQSSFPNIPQMKTDYSFQHFNFTDPGSGDAVAGLSYPDFQPKRDVDGNMTSGVRTAELMVPLATYTGWNPALNGAGLCPATGSYIPFAPTKAARSKNGDPRLSVEERYPTEGDYVAAMRKATAQLVRDGFMLADDAKTLMDGSAARYAKALRGAQGE